MNADILRRVRELPYDDPRRKALLEILHNEYATNLLTGLPVQGVLFKPAKWKEQVSVYMGLPPPETRKSVNQHIIIKGVIRGKVDLHAYNLLNSHYATGGGTSLNHNTILGNVEVGYTTPVFLSSPPDLLMDKAPRTSSSDNFLKTRAALHSRKQTKSYQIL